MAPEMMYIFSVGDGRYVFVAIHPWSQLIYYNENEDVTLGAGSVRADFHSRLQNEAAFLQTLSPRMDLLPHYTTPLGRTYALEQGLVHYGRYAYAEANEWTGQVMYCRYVDCGPTLPQGLVFFPEAVAIETALQYARSLPGVVGVAVRAGEACRVTVEMDVVQDATSGELVNLNIYAGGSASPAPKTKQQARKHVRWQGPKPLSLYIDGTSRQTSFPPMLCGGRPYIWVRWACALASKSHGPAGACLNGGNAAITLGSNRYVGTLGSARLAGPHRVVRLSAPLKIIGNRLYLPADSLQPLLAAHVGYVRGANRLDIVMSTKEARVR